MCDDIQFSSRVGDDGILSVQINLGHSEANREVIVTVQSREESEPHSKQASRSWPKFLRQTYGSCADLGLERGDQGDFEKRESLA